MANQNKLPKEYPISLHLHVKHPNEEGKHGDGHNEHRYIVLDGLMAPADKNGFRQYPGKDWQQKVLEKALGSHVMAKAFGSKPTGAKKQHGDFQKTALSWKTFQDGGQNEKVVPIKGKVQLCSYALSFGKGPSESITHSVAKGTENESRHPRHMKRPKPETKKKKSLKENYRSLIGTYMALQEEMIGSQEIIDIVNQGNIEDRIINVPPEVVMNETVNPGVAYCANMITVHNFLRKR